MNLVVHYQIAQKMGLRMKIVPFSSASFLSDITTARRRFRRSKATIVDQRVQIKVPRYFDRFKWGSLKLN